MEGSMQRVTEMTAERAEEEVAKSWKMFWKRVEVSAWIASWILLIGGFEYIRMM